MQGNDVVSRLLVAADVGTVFTLMSEDTMRLLSTLEEEWHDSIRLVKTRHEQGAVAMADGYARASDRVGVCLVGRGPAVAQTGTAMVTARKNDSNVLVVVPEPPLSDDYDIKAFEQEAYLRSTLGAVTSIRSRETLVSSFREALRRVKVGDGPLAVGIPWDVLDGSVDLSADVSFDAAVDTGDARAPAGTVQPSRERIERAIDMYVESAAFQPPVILAGRGAVRAGAKDALERLATRTSAVLATSLKGRDYFADHPFSLGVTGAWGSDLANRYVNESHLVFAVGASLNPYTIDEGHIFGEDTQVIHVDRDPAQLGRHADVDLGIQGDARVTVEALLEELDRRNVDRDGELWSDSLRREIAETPTMNEREFPDVAGAMDPRDLVRRLDEMLPDQRKVVTDGGHFTRWVVDGIHSHPADFTFTLDFASIGLGLPMGIGTAIAADDHATIAVCGDAGLMMSLQELETAVRNEVPVTVVVVNDDSLGSEYHSLDAHNVAPEAALVDAPDFADVAEAVGAKGHTVRSLDELDDLSEELGTEPDGPVVVDCKVNHHVRHRSKM